MPRAGVQSMTNTDTVDAIGTAIQVWELAQAGSSSSASRSSPPRRLRRCPTSANSWTEWVKVGGWLVISTNGHRLLTEFPDCAQALSKYRINPGNVGNWGQARQAVWPDDRSGHAMEQGRAHWCQLGQSLDQELLAELMDTNSRRSTPGRPGQVMYEALITSAIESARRGGHRGWTATDHPVDAGSVGAGSDFGYRELARRCDYALHLGLTEAGMGNKGTVASAAALSVLLQEGIGDTIRVSLTPPARRGAYPGSGCGIRTPLQAFGHAGFVPSVTACSWMWPYHQHHFSGPCQAD